MEKKNIKYAYLINLSLCVFMIVYGIIIGINDNDFGWNYKVGEWIIQNKTIPTKDIFSWYGIRNDYIWYSHEWLSDVILYFIVRWFGYSGISIFTGLIKTIFTILLMKLTENKWKENIIFASFWFAFETFILFEIGCRVYLFSFIFLILELYLLFKFIENENTKGIYFIPLISIFWVNMHGSANLSYLLILIFLICGIIKSFSFERLLNIKLTHNGIKKLSIVFVMTFLANFINPYGLDIVSHPYIYTSNSSFDMFIISEWQALDLKTTMGILYAIPLVISAVAIISSNKKIEINKLLIFGMFTYLMLKSIRFQPLFFIVISFIVFDYLPKVIDKLILNKYFKLIIGFMCSIILIFNVAILSISTNYKWMNFVLSNEVISMIKEYDGEHLLNFYDYGDNLILNDIDVFIDSRADVYSMNGDLLKESWAIFYLNADYLDEPNTFDMDYYFDEKFKFDTILIPESLPLNTYLETREDFIEIYNKNGVCFWIRN